MAVDSNARFMTIGFPGGSLTAKRGVLVSLFGPDLINTSALATRTVSRKAHSRVRVIGGPSTSVDATSFTAQRFPSAGTSPNATGESIRLLIDGDWWTARLSGSHQSFNKWLKDSTWGSGKAAMWRSQKGKPYGPFVPAAPPIVA
jgi:hypothetical protein